MTTPVPSHPASVSPNMASVLAPLRRPRFRRLVTAQFVAETGDGITMVALPLYVFARTNSALATSLTFTAEVIGAVFLGFIGGMLADAFDRRRVLMISAVLRGLLLLVAFLAGPIWLAVTFGVLARALGAADNPSFDALVPGQAEDDLQQVLAIRRLIQGVSITLGPGLGALAVQVVGARTAIVLNAVTFAIVLAVYTTLPGLDRSFAQRRAQRDGVPIRHTVIGLARGMTVAATTPAIRRLALYWCITSAFVAAVIGASVIWYEVDLGVSGAWFGLAMAAYGVGAAIGTGLSGGHRFTTPLPVIMVRMIPVYALCSVVGVVAEVPWLLPLGWLLWGIALGPELVLGEVLVVNAVDEDTLGRTFAGLNVGMTVGMSIGYAVIGPLLERHGARPVIIGTAVLQLLAGVVWIRPALAARRL